jgi:hypothetical protein
MANTIISLLYSVDQLNYGYIFLFGTNFVMLQKELQPLLDFVLFLGCSSQGIEYVINDARLSDPQQWSEVGVAHYFLGGTS